MPSTSKSKLRIPKKFKFLPKAKQVKQHTRNWLDLPSDVMANILYRIGVYDILENAQKVFTAWRNICKDPAMWSVINMDTGHEWRYKLCPMCKHAVDLSQGQLIDISMGAFCNDQLLLYVAKRSTQLRRLKVTCCYGNICGCWVEALKKFPLLEELSLYSTKISKDAIETAGRYCPTLKTLKLNQEAYRFWNGNTNEESIMSHNEIAIAIGENLHGLKHLELIGNTMRNIGLQAILDGCCHLKSLDLRRCFNIDLEGDLGKRCSEQFSLIRLKIQFSLRGFDAATKPKLLLDDPDDYDDEYDDAAYYVEDFGGMDMFED